mmetsp:Transcript_34128/g.82083  ORF Transcript_34128/g.82083 Transcript_34128/m.82083 type:complete len:914 (-) Transcript_34128:1906-4647(-)
MRQRYAFICSMIRKKWEAQNKNEISDYPCEPWLDLWMTETLPTGRVLDLSEVDFPERPEGTRPVRPGDEQSDHDPQQESSGSRNKRRKETTSLNEDDSVNNKRPVARPAPAADRKHGGNRKAISSLGHRGPGEKKHSRDDTGFRNRDTAASKLSTANNNRTRSTAAVATSTTAVEDNDHHPTRSATASSSGRVSSKKKTTLTKKKDTSTSLSESQNHDGHPILNTAAAKHTGAEEYAACGCDGPVDGGDDFESPDTAAAPDTEPRRDNDRRGDSVSSSGSGRRENKRRRRNDIPHQISVQKKKKKVVMMTYSPPNTDANDDRGHCDDDDNNGFENGRRGISKRRKHSASLTDGDSEDDDEEEEEEEEEDDGLGSSKKKKKKKKYSLSGATGENRNTDLEEDADTERRHDQESVSSPGPEEEAVDGDGRSDSVNKSQIESVPHEQAYHPDYTTVLNEASKLSTTSGDGGYDGPAGNDDDLESHQHGLGDDDAESDSRDNDTERISLQQVDAAYPRDLQFQHRDMPYDHVQFSRFKICLPPVQEVDEGTKEHNRNLLQAEVDTLGTSNMSLHFSCCCCGQTYKGSDIQPSKYRNLAEIFAPLVVEVERGKVVLDLLRSPSLPQEVPDRILKTSKETIQHHLDSCTLELAVPTEENNATGDTRPKRLVAPRRLITNKSDVKNLSKYHSVRDVCNIPTVPDAKKTNARYIPSAQVSLNPSVLHLQQWFKLIQGPQNIDWTSWIYIPTPQRYAFQCVAIRVEWERTANHFFLAEYTTPSWMIPWRSGDKFAPDAYNNGPLFSTASVASLNQPEIPTYSHQHGHNIPHPLIESPFHSEALSLPRLPAGGQHGQELQRHSQQNRWHHAHTYYHPHPLGAFFIHRPPTGGQNAYQQRLSLRADPQYATMGGGTADGDVAEV